MLQHLNDNNRLLYAYNMEWFSLVDQSCDIETQEEDSPAVEPTDGSGNVSTWQSCAICLEEMLDAELMSHPSCGCVLCQGCIEVC